MRPENERMQKFLAANGITAHARFIWTGSLKGCWRLHGIRRYPNNGPWTEELRNKLNALGFTDFNGKPLGRYSGNGGSFSVFVLGHNEFLDERKGR